MACPVAARAWLGGLLRDFPGPLGPAEAPPWSPAGVAPLRPDEAPAELAELARGFLGRRNAPPLLAASLIHTAVTEMLQSGLGEFKQQNLEEEATSDSGTCPFDRVPFCKNGCGFTLDPLECETMNALPLSLHEDLETNDDSVGEDGLTSTILEGGPLQCYFFNKLLEICCEWQKELPALKLSKRYLQISIHATRNTRRKMEDKHVSLPEFNQLFGLEDGVDRAYFAVFDGHGGIEAANYAAIHLHANLAHHKELLENPEEALRDSFQKTDEMFLSRAKREKLRSGTTGVSSFIVEDKLHIAWLGDSQVMLVQKGKVITLMEPHKPEREDERQRIEALGGCVTYMDCWRVNGTLAVSRAIGDLLQKPYISGCADSASFELTGAEDYVVLACDGFFDTIQPVEMVDHVLEHLMQSQGDGLQTAERLVAVARQSGSTDNITVLVVFLREPKDIVADCLRDPKSCPVDDGAAGPLFSFFRPGANH